MAEFSIEVKGLDKLQSTFNAAPNTVRAVMNPVLHTAVNILAKYTVKGTVPWRTGRLTQSFIATYGDLLAMWRPTVKYAMFVHEGTGPHVIVPLNKKALYWKGAAHPVRKVNHPGIRSNPFMPRIIQNSKSDVDALLKKGLDQLTGAIANGTPS